MFNKVLSSGCLRICDVRQLIHLLPLVSFYTSEIQRFSDVFRGYKKKQWHGIGYYNLSYMEILKVMS